MRLLPCHAYAAVLGHVPLQRPNAIISAFVSTLVWHFMAWEGIPSAKSSRSVRGLGKGVSGKPYPRLCNARSLGLEPGTFRSQAVRLYCLPFRHFMAWEGMLKLKK